MHTVQGHALFLCSGLAFAVLLEALASVSSEQESDMAVCQVEVQSRLLILPRDLVLRKITLPDSAFTKTTFIFIYSNQ